MRGRLSNGGRAREIEQSALIWRNRTHGMGLANVVAMRISTAFHRIGVVLVFAGCASNSGDESPTMAGTAPTIRGLTISPMTIEVAKLATLSGQFDFEDPDGDLAQIGLTIRTAGQSTTVPKSNLQNLSGQKSGKGIYAAAAQVPQAGPVDLLVVVYDAAGHASNELQVTVAAQ